MEAYKSIPEVEIVAGVDILQERLDVMETKWGLPKKALFKDWKVMLKKIKPDAVDVCTPNGVHCAPVVDACLAGCHAMVEKPMAMNPAECEKMIAAAKKGKVKLSVGFQQRYNTNTTALIQARKNGQFGDIMFVRCQALRRRGIPNWGVFGQKELQGGGPMIDLVYSGDDEWFTNGKPSGESGVLGGSKLTYRLAVTLNLGSISAGVSAFVPCRRSFDSGSLDMLSPSFDETMFSAAVLFNF